MHDVVPMINWLSTRADVTPNAPALVCSGKRYTYRELDAHAYQAATRMASIGVTPDKRVAVLLPSCSEHIILIHALTQLGAVFVPLNIKLTSSELSLQLESAGCTHLVWGHQTVKLAEHFHTTLSCINVTDLIDLSTTPRGSTLRSVDHATLLPATHANRIHSIVFTSGTTGQPRGAHLTYANHFYSATASAYRLGILPTDRWMLCLPLWHVGGLAIVVRACLYGIPIVAIENTFEASDIRRAMEIERVTLVSLVPTMLQRLIRPGEHAPEALRCVLLGGAAAPQHLLSEALASKWPIAITYGLTEAASQVCTAPPDLTARKPGCVGKPLLGVSVEVCTPEGTPLPSGQIGQIVVSGPIIMRGVCGQHTTASSILRKDKLYTRDVGYIDPEGDLWILQRQDDMIISGGENVNPHEVEITLCQHPDVEDACVVGLADPEWGQRVAALVVAENVTPRDLQHFCRQRLSHYKQPKTLQLTSELPRTQSGKLQRAIVRHRLTSHTHQKKCS